MLEQKINELEVKFSHQDYLVDQLNKIVMKQQIAIDQIHKDLLELKLSQSENSSQTRSLKDDVPPHY